MYTLECNVVAATENSLKQAIGRYFVPQNAVLEKQLAPYVEQYLSAPSTRRASFALKNAGTKRTMLQTSERAEFVEVHLMEIQTESIALTRAHT